jgi:crotonobetainyl-CoA:carnitine CoA-transferase CaiB-like acyl-CoA transferase
VSAESGVSADERPFSGLRVFDATQGVAGPHATMLLALHGADVVKVEPLAGDWGRSIGRTYDDYSAHGIAFNRAKRSIALDLKSEAGRAVAQELARGADIVVESFRPGVMHRFGLGHEQLSAQRNDLIYCSVSGFGQRGPWRDRKVSAVSLVDHPGVGEIPIASFPGLPPDEMNDADMLAPHVGQHSLEILTEAGYETAAIESLLDSNSVGVYG